MNPVPSRNADARTRANSRSVLSGPVDPPHETGLRDFVQNICRLFNRRMKQQRVNCCVDVDSNIRVTIAPRLTGDVLAHLIEEALTAMPDGGQLDVIAVVGPDGLEIEVADSGNANGFVLRIHNATSREWDKVQGLAAGTGMRIETMTCPQGGVARTLFIPWMSSRAAA